MTLTLSASDLIVVNQNQPRTTSTKVADAFGKLHKNVIQRIESLDCSAEFASANFSAHEEIIQAGAVKRRSKVYEMTKDGFMFLVMGFTGKKAAQIKEAYINAFNEMAEKLHGKPARKKPKALPNGLNLEQQDAIKSLVKARVEAVAPDRRAKAAITCWSALKSKFGCTYKEIEPELFTDAASLVARVPLEGEYIAAQPEPAGLTEHDLSQLRCLIGHCRGIDAYFVKRIGPALRQLNPEMYFSLREHVFVANRQAASLEKRLLSDTGQRFLA